MTKAPTSPPESHWLGFDLGGSKMYAQAYDSQFRALGSRRTRTKGHGNASKGLEHILKTIHRALEDAELTADQISGIGFGYPGAVNMATGEVSDAVNLGWSDVPLREAIEKEFQCPVSIANDVDLGVYGEYCFGAARKSRCVLGVFPGTGIGGGCVYQGEILHGQNSTCMEIGHIQVNPHGRLCGCGRHGCLEAEAGRLAIASEAAMAAHRGQAPHLLEKAGADLRNIRSSALASSVAAGDKAIEKIVRNAAEKIGRAVANMTLLLCPDTIVLGGGVVEAMSDIFLETVWETARTTTLPSFADSFQVKIAELGDDAAVMGAAAWAMRAASAHKNAEPSRPLEPA